MRIITQRDLDNRIAELDKLIQDATIERDKTQAELRAHSIQRQELEKSRTAMPSEAIEAIAMQVTELDMKMVELTVKKAQADEKIQKIEEDKARLEKDSPNNSAINKLQSYIPAAIVAAYLAIDEIIKQASGIPTAWVYLAVFVALLVLTPIYAWQGTKKKAFQEHIYRSQL